MAHDNTNGIHRGSRRLTIEDVATEAGVSVATVSRALRGLPNVTPSTREHVEAVADRLEYHPDPAAARLAAGRTRTITLAVPSLSRPKQAQIARRLEKMGLEVQTLPSFSQLIGEEALVNKLTPVSAKSFLGRAEIKHTLGEAGNCYENRVVLISGAGGSIGSEL